jgi:hypothetical protein
LSTLSAKSIAPSPTSRATAGAEWLLIMAIFFLYAGWPVPDVNEVHYLSKAKHYWNPDWCQGDFFCESADAHLVFYWSFGWLTKFFSLTATAWIGRVVSWGVLAWAWRRLSLACVPAPWLSVLSAGLWICLLDQCHMAGEWVVGGLEAKGVAYALMFLGLEALLRKRWNWVWILLGAATAFHVLVGGWMLIVCAGVWLTRRDDRPSIRSMMPSLTVGFVLSLPGVLPALGLTATVDGETFREANYIYVFRRLKHHLILTEFKWQFVARHTALIISWFLLARFIPKDSPLRRLRPVIHGAVALAAIGLIINLATLNDKYLAASLLRYYWFRLSDAMVPLGVAMVVCRWIVWVREQRSRWANLPLVVAIIAVGAGLAPGLVEQMNVRHPRSERPQKSVIDSGGWRDVCDWIAENTADDAQFLVPRQASTFRWRTGRALVVCHKDIPQDSRGIVEWWTRIDAIYRYPSDPEKPERRSWHGSLADESLGEQRLIELCDRYGADYIVTHAERPLGLEIAYSNPWYVVYRPTPTPWAGRLRAPSNEK